MEMAATLLVEDALPALALLNDGRGHEAMITRAQASRIDEFLHALSAVDEGGALARAIQQERAAGVNFFL